MSNSKKIAQTSIKKNYIYNTIYQVLSLITPLITAPYISRVLGSIPMNEEYCGYIDCNLARSGYNEAKRTCEALTQSYRSVFGVNAVIARFTNVD